MAIEITCPGCARRLRLADEHAGQRGKCPACQTQFDIPIAAPPFQNQLPLPPAPTAAPPANDSWANFADSLQGSRPAAPSYVDSQNPFAAPRTTGYTPHKSSRDAAQAYGIASLVLGSAGLLMNLLAGCCCPFGIVGLALSGVGVAMAFYAEGGLRTSALIVNCVSLAIMMGWLVFLFVFAVLREM